MRDKLGIARRILRHSGLWDSIRYIGRETRREVRLLRCDHPFVRVHGHVGGVGPCEASETVNDMRFDVVCERCKKALEKGIRVSAGERELIAKELAAQPPIYMTPIDALDISLPDAVRRTQRAES